MSREFRARVFVEVEVEPGAPRAYREDPALAFSIRARTVDGAAEQVEKRLRANRRRVTSIAHSPNCVVVAKVARELLPPDAPGAMVVGGIRRQ
jgi:hypothetical protein